MSGGLLKVAVKHGSAIEALPTGMQVRGMSEDAEALAARQRVSAALRTVCKD